MFINLPELYGLSVQLLASLDECMEMAGKVEGVAQCSQAGFVFEEIAEVKGVSVECINVICIFCGLVHHFDLEATTYCLIEQWNSTDPNEKYDLLYPCNSTI